MTGPLDHAEEKLARNTSHAPAPKPTLRQLVVRFALWGCAHEPQIHYAEIRPIPKVTPHTLPALPFTTDCSGFATMAYEYAGAQDPNGNGYNGQGYTGTLLAHARKVGAIVGIGKVQPGDIAIYGTKSIPAGHHAAVVTAVHSRSYGGIVTASHGQEKGPFEITVAEEAQYQPDGIAGVVFLHLPPA